MVRQEGDSSTERVGGHMETI